MGEKIEFPPGSGKVGDYEPHERQYMKDLVALERTGKITSAQMREEMLTIHEFKASLDSAIWPDETARADRQARGEPEPESLSPWEPSDDAPSMFGTDAFPVPQKAQEKLAARPAATQAHARQGDPWTSHEAARSLSPDDLRATQQAVLACFRRHGAMHHEVLVSAYESEHAAEGWPKQSVSGLRTRTSELVAASLVRDSGRTVELASGRRSIVWEPVRGA